MKLYLDEDLSPRIAERVRNRGVDCISAHETGMLGASDLDQLMFAASQKRCLATKNRDDFIQLTVRFFNDSLPHFGLLIVSYSVPGDRFSQIARAMVDYALAHPKGLHAYTIDFL